MPAAVDTVSGLVATFALAVAASSSGIVYVLYRLLLSTEATPSVSPARWFVVTCAPLAISFYAAARGSLSRSGAVAAVPVGLTLSLAHAGDQRMNFT